MPTLEGKVIAVTGGASGMGLCIARLLAERGAIISLADMNEKGLQAAIESLAGSKKHIYTVVDVTKSASVNAWMERTAKEIGELDGAVNFAGVIKFENSVKTETDENWNLVMGVNATGVFNAMRAELNHMKDGGSIVSAASVNAIVATPMLAAYVASKHAVVGLTKTAARENPNVRINCVAPGGVKTPMQDGVDPDVETAFQVQRRLADPSEIANIVAFLLSDEATFVTGATWTVDGGWTC